MFFEHNNWFPVNARTHQFTRRRDTLRYSDWNYYEVEAHMGIFPSSSVTRQFSFAILGAILNRLAKEAPILRRLYCNFQ